MTHTPGPWTIFDFHGTPRISAEPNNRTLGHEIAMVAGIGNKTREHQLANAHLIKASPALLDALIDMTAIAIGAGIKMDNPHVKKARAAIADATGNS